MKVKECSQEMCSFQCTNKREKKASNPHHNIHIKRLIKDCKLSQKKAEGGWGKKDESSTY